VRFKKFATMALIERTGNRAGSRRFGETARRPPPQTAAHSVRSYACWALRGDIIL
jgi:hypothetical protein